jgi:hypothetical protein
MGFFLAFKNLCITICWLDKKKPFMSHHRITSGECIGKERILLIRLTQFVLEPGVKRVQFSKISSSQSVMFVNLLK